jgi:hypothetical protein
MTNSVSEMDKVINKLKLKYRTYILEYDAEDVGYCFSSFNHFKFQTDLVINDVNIFLKQMLLYQGHCEQMLDRGATSVKLVDGCGNVWECILIFGTAPYDHCRIGGQWKRFVDERNLYECVKIRLGAPAAATMKQHMCRFIAVKVGVHEAGIC